MGVVLPFDGARGILKPGGPQTLNPAYFAVPNGLVGYWGFDADCVLSSTLTADLSGNGNHGTLVNAPGLAPGPVDAAMSLTSGPQNYVAVGGISFLQSTTAFSVAFWFKRTSPGSIIEFSNTTTGFPATAIEIWSDGNIYLEPTSNANNYGAMTSNDALWHHLTMVFNGAATGNSLRLLGFLDGVPRVLSFSGTVAASTTGGSSTLYLGRLSSTYSNGSIDDVRIYNRALDPWEVIQLYQAGLAGRRDAGMFLPQSAELDALLLSSQVKFRKTLSGFGSGVGKRQLQGA